MPAPSRLVRSLGPAHVAVLKEELREVWTTFCVVAGVYYILDRHGIQKLEKSAKGIKWFKMVSPKH